jgi:hypothetical protein
LAVGSAPADRRIRRALREPEADAWWRGVSPWLSRPSAEAGYSGWDNSRDTRGVDAGLRHDRASYRVWSQRRVCNRKQARHTASRPSLLVMGMERGKRLASRTPTSTLPCRAASIKGVSQSALRDISESSCPWSTRSSCTIESWSLCLYITVGRPLNAPGRYPYHNLFAAGLRGKVQARVALVFEIRVL